MDPSDGLFKVSQSADGQGGEHTKATWRGGGELLLLSKEGIILKHYRCLTPEELLMFQQAVQGLEVVLDLEPKLDDVVHLNLSTYFSQVVIEGVLLLTCLGSHSC